MKRWYLSIWIIFFLFVLPAVCFAGGKLQIEDPVFDFKSQTSTAQTNPCDEFYFCEGYIYGRVLDNKTHEPLKDVSVELKGVKLKKYNKKYEENTRTKKSGCFAFGSPSVAPWSKLDVHGTYRISVTDNSYKEYKCEFKYLGICLHGFNIYLNKKHFNKPNSIISGLIRGKDGNRPDGPIHVELYGEKTKAEKNLTLKYWESYFEFTELPSDRYILTIKLPKENKTRRVKIRLSENMLKSFYTTFK